MTGNGAPAFQPFTIGDVDELIGMMRELYGPSVRFDDETARKGLALIAAANTDTTATIATIFPGRVWLIRSNDPNAGSVRNAGYVVLTSVFSIELGGWCGLLDELFLREEFRGRGWGTAAIDLAVSTCRDLGVATLLLEVDLGNERALELYRRRGFLEHRRRLMRLDVGPG